MVHYGLTALLEFLAQGQRDAITAQVKAQVAEATTHCAEEDGLYTFRCSICSLPDSIKQELISTLCASNSQAVNGIIEIHECNHLTQQLCESAQVEAVWGKYDAV